MVKLYLLYMQIICHASRDVFQWSVLLLWSLKGIVHPKMLILSLITHPHVDISTDIFGEIRELSDPA